VLVPAGVRINPASRGIWVVIGANRSA